MRFTPTLKLSTRLVAFVTIIVISATFILFVGGTLTFKKIGQEYLNHYLDGIVVVVDREMEDPESAQSMQRWMPKMLQASRIVEMQLSSPAGIVYQFNDTDSRVDPSRLYNKTYRLERNSGYQVTFKAVPPYLGSTDSFGALWTITLAVSLIIFCLVRGVKWLKEQLLGSELLEERGRMILAGRVEQFAKGDLREWPYTASEALDCLIEELQDARQERSRFDTFIRTQTFLDQLTGTANRVLFDSKLESVLHESGSHGAVILLRVDDWEDVKELNGKSVSDDFIVELAEAISGVIQRYPDVLLSRYYSSDFAIFVPYQGTKEVTHLVNACMKQLVKISPPSPVDKDNWCHMGVTNFNQGDRQGKIMDEAEIALKSAQLQQINTWSRFNKATVDQEDRGSVRWRTLFDQTLTPENIRVFGQPCYLLSATSELKLIHHELFARIDDPEKGTLKASRFNAAIEQVGYELKMDRAILRKTITCMKESQLNLCYSVNLHVSPFADKEHFKWLRNELLQLTSQTRLQLSFEFSEGRLIKHLDYMRPVIRMLSGLGCQVIVGQAGRTIVSTHYLKDLKVDYLKLHRSLIKRIDQRDENQLFVRSIIGACSGGKTQVIAVGVETKAEHKTLIDLGVHGVQGRLFDTELEVWARINNKAHTNVSNKIKPGRRNRWR
ncbi:RNase E specificity factor CsrD [Vibrio genomosp. F10]|uniref:RNase E specificity factor CsrD n=2 Tax=Vibrio genomosp. F10 TaxID=723171 RepID=A0A1B9R388_9VIBR|nr:RNase E specificity factor CsrD [Vibrio genomosp. F10]OCH78645.1 RNase E specificity factor CsrD [Vibrio genomosp. F10]OEE33525.1 RNase E specificity factor CsrD [Vibrio genomosp. F10 str. ZF-129]OEE96234.1 RNase E specificity factor CsrD [Vibrio genomosp. F10 str. 9ZC157]OEE97245.1 RNase E specificity factor CsrD [Vibrio genomosp. F10 str. 9ZD137]OEF06917.1 RNase E specificity factor CsrD [Vibrio genomosp. F10 str. 9ZB36]